MANTGNPRHRKQAEPPRREGWVIARNGDQWRATRVDDLSTWQIAYGCNLMLFADSFGELDLLISAEKIKDSMIDLCARLVDGIGEAAAKRRAQVAET